MHALAKELETRIAFRPTSPLISSHHGATPPSRSRTSAIGCPQPRPGSCQRRAAPMPASSCGGPTTTRSCPHAALVQRGRRLLDHRPVPAVVGSARPRRGGPLRGRRPTAHGHHRSHAAEHAVTGSRVERHGAPLSPCGSPAMPPSASQRRRRSHRDRHTPFVASRA